MPSKQYLKDAAERVAWQVGYAVLSSGIVYIAGLKYAWAPTLMVALNLAKVLIAQYIGDHNNAAIPGGSQTPAPGEPVATITPINSTGGAA